MVLKIIDVIANLFRTGYKGCQYKILSFVAQLRWEIEYAHNNWPHTVRVPHLSEWIHSIHAKSKLDISWFIREILLMSKIKLFPHFTICRVSNLSICLVIHMLKEQLSIPWF
jgi:hypothetical protein